ncbi:osmotically inducible protein OsmC [Arachidicoccus rhizosphaerae]|jgi:osmotically inducible protein OsmC|uniref:Osmotically inducible protein OsmC n=1 Tax=Arachidicoccus rhizosphaerae TaxID=551991 RepID=A0A1H3WHF6_9BACT|nr:OsmC family protein [Arachidicoccus rhizosphaerae]SDZ86586.1 osmotically inducible protein OsmC [Arachidicoccus rhizosphaerae]
MKRSATAVWKGSIKEGSGVLTTDSKTLDNTQYSFKSRFETGTGTNPEELIGAAHAGCFAMALSLELGNAGFTPESLEATATVTMDPEKLEITSSNIQLKAKIPGITDEQFQKIAAGAKAGCPISKLLKAEISLQASLVS